MNKLKEEKIKVIIALSLSLAFIAAAIFAALLSDNYFMFSVLQLIGIALSFYAEEKSKKIIKKKSFTDKVKEQIDS